MKKLIAMILALTLVMGLAACGTTKEPTEEKEPVAEENVVIETPVVEDETLNEPAAMPEEGEGADVMPEVTPEEELPAIEFMPEEKLNEMLGLLDQLVGGINDELMVMNTEITSDMFEYLVGIAPMEGAYAVASAPMIGSIAHEVVLVELPEGTDVAAVAAEMEGNMDPRKWICVEAESCWVKTSGNYVVKVMSTNDMSAAIEANFNTVFGG